MENNLYYTPTIEEFHVGFEYERLWLHIEPPMWGKETFYLNDSHIKLMQYSLSDIEPLARVKFLDQSDIESLGWVIAESSHKHIRAIIDLCSENKEKWILIYDIKDNYMVILKDVMGMTSFFRGEIKNKSELIKLMQQLNIK